MLGRISQSTSCRRSNPPARVDKDLSDLNPDTSYRIEGFHPQPRRSGCCHSSAELAACAQGLIKGLTTVKARKGHDTRFADLAPKDAAVRMKGAERVGAGPRAT